MQKFSWSQGMKLDVKELIRSRRRQTVLPKYELEVLLEFSDWQEEKMFLYWNSIKFLEKIASNNSNPKGKLHWLATKLRLLDTVSRDYLDPSTTLTGPSQTYYWLSSSDIFSLYVKDPIVEYLSAETTKTLAWEQIARRMLHWKLSLPDK